jgi:hypothetical protein
LLCGDNDAFDGNLDEEDPACAACVQGRRLSQVGIVHGSTVYNALLLGLFGIAEAGKFGDSCDTLVPVGKKRDAPTIAQKNYGLYDLLIQQQVLTAEDVSQLHQFSARREYCSRVADFVEYQETCFMNCGIVSGDEAKIGTALASSAFKEFEPFYSSLQKLFIVTMQLAKIIS